MYDDEFEKKIKPSIKLNHNKDNATTNEDAKERKRVERNSASQFAVCPWPSLRKRPTFRDATTGFPVN